MSISEAKNRVSNFGSVFSRQFKSIVLRIRFYSMGQPADVIMEDRLEKMAMVVHQKESCRAWHYYVSRCASDLGVIGG